MHYYYKIITGNESVQGSPEWLAFRKGKISASLAPSIMGVGFQTPLEAWESIVLDKPIQKTAAMERGNQLESVSREMFNKSYKMNYQPVVVQSIPHPDFIASLDGYCEIDGKPQILEIKCAGPVDHATALSGEVPPKYWPQLQHQMDLVGVDSMTYISFDGKENVVIEVERDEEYCKELFQKELSFLASIIDLVPPKPTDKDWIELSGDSYLNDTIALYNDICERLDALEESKKKLKEEIVNKMTHPRIKIGKNRIQQIVRKGDVDYAKLIDDLELDVNLNAYRKPSSTFWKIAYG